MQGADWAGGLLGDKANCALFDTTKIKRLVPGFHCPTRFDQGARLALKHILKEPGLQPADPDFDAFCDRTAAMMQHTAAQFEEMKL